MGWAAAGGVPEEIGLPKPQAPSPAQPIIHIARLGPVRPNRQLVGHCAVGEHYPGPVNANDKPDHYLIAIRLTGGSQRSLRKPALVLIRSWAVQKLK